jgi:hypothetical protein
MTVRNERGEITSFALYGKEVTERKWAKEVLGELYERESYLRRQLEAEIERRIESTRGLVYELRTPVIAIMDSSRLVADDIDRSASDFNCMVGEPFEMPSGEM